MSIFAAGKRVFVGVPVYNNESFLQQTLESIEGQTYSGFRVLISDNASTDGTGEICRNVCGKDKRFSYVRHAKNVGSHRSGAYLLDQCNSEFATFIGGHDHVAPSYLAKHVDNLDKHPEASLSYSQVAWKDEAGNHVQTTPGGDYIFPAEFRPAQRVMGVIKAVCECTAINQVMRHKFLLDYPVSRVVGGNDRIALTHLIAHGPFVRIEEPLYFSLMPERSETNGLYDMDAHMERISGVGKPEMEAMERFMGVKNSEIREADHVIEHIRCIWHHKNLGREEKMHIIWFLLNVFEMYRKWSQPAVRKPFAYEKPAEMIIND